MRAVQKGPIPADFAAHQAADEALWGRPSDSAQAQACWGRFAGPVKRGFREKCLEEQGWLCAYCEGPIGRHPSIKDATQHRPDVHLDHVAPKSLHPERTLDPSNLLASCQAPGHCGRAKGDQTHPCHPLQSNPNHFGWDLGGRAIPRDADECQSLEVLKLNADELRSQRGAAIEGHLGLDPKEELLGPLSREDCRSLAPKVGLPDSEGRLEAYASSIQAALMLLAEW